MNNALNWLRWASYDYSSNGMLWGGGVKRWLKKEIPLEDRKKLFNSLGRWTSQEQLSKEYLFIQYANWTILWTRGSNCSATANTSRWIVDVIPADTIDHILE